MNDVQNKPHPEDDRCEIGLKLIADLYAAFDPDMLETLKFAYLGFARIWHAQRINEMGQIEQLQILGAVVGNLIADTTGGDVPGGRYYFNKALDRAVEELRPAYGHSYNEGQKLSRLVKERPQ
jgi:hypothetical protein